ncbi:hypothetical protein OGY18_13275, partial [Citrobacter sp. Cpo142]|nr:hypothetical protein [Citrobacter sp. Cpo142]
KSAQIREILISESAWEEMTCLFAPSLTDFASGTAHCSYSHLMTPGCLVCRWVIGINRRNLIQMDEIFYQTQ